VPKHKDFGFQRSARPEQPIKAHQINLQRSLIVELSTDSRASVSCFGFAVGTGVRRRIMYVDRQLGNFEPELQQLAMDSRGAPERVLFAHTPDEIT